MKWISRILGDKTTSLAKPSIASSQSAAEILDSPQLPENRQAWLRSLLVFMISSIILIWAFRAEILGAIAVWSELSTFGHAFFIFPITVFLIYRLRHRLAGLRPQAAPWALALIAALMLVWAISDLANAMVAKQFAFVALWQAMFLLIFGWGVTSAAIFPLAYLYLAIPFGLSIIPPLQDVTAHIVVHLLRLTGMPVFLDGYHIQIPSGSFLVAEACSGVRYLMVCLALGILAAYLFFHSWTRRILFLALSVVVPILANGIRAYGIIMIAHLSDYTLAIDIDHVIYGFIFLGLVLLCLLGVGALLREAGPVRDSGAPAVTLAAANGPAERFGGYGAQILFAAVAVLAIFAVQVSISTAKTPPTSLATIRYEPVLGSVWQAVANKEVGSWKPDFRGMDAQLQQSYRGDGEQIDLHVAYYDYQREGAEAVSDLNRLVGARSEWQLLEADPVTVQVRNSVLSINSALVQSRHRTFLVWYWYWIGGENTSSRLTGKLLEMTATVMGGQRAGAVIALASEVKEDRERVEALLRSFLQQALDGSATLFRIERAGLHAPQDQRRISASCNRGPRLGREFPPGASIEAMCGLTGIFDTRDGRPIDRDFLTVMTDSLQHRGPDGAGYHVGEGVGLGHRRLSIIDLAGGHQPLFNEDHSVCVVYNGEIYNFQELATELRNRGHRFRTVCDTEVVVHGWEEWGPDCVKRFRGMFAFALWDNNSKTLFLARDRLGIKPLYYSLLADGRLLFASEMKALLCAQELDRRFDMHAIEDYFAYGYVPDPKSIYQSVRKLPPAHVLVWKRGLPAARPQSYWDIEFKPNPRIREADACVELRERLSEAVKSHLISDVPLGAFLSGGVNSSSVVSMMAEHSTTPVNTCAIGFDVAAFDEASYAEVVARHLKSHHRSRQVTANSFDLIEDMSSFYDEPFADSSAMPTYQVCRLARETVTVALSGDGGDEAFAGYRRYRWHHYEEMVRGLLPAPLRRPLFSLLGEVYPKLDWAPQPLRAKSTFQALARDSVEGYFHSVSIVSDRLRRGLYSERMQRDLQGYHARTVLADIMRDAPVEHHLDRVQYADMKSYLPGDILTKVDRASMATSLEVRVPLLDHVLLEWAATLPVDLRLRRREGKYLLKKAMAERLPHDILYRQKMGFSVPLAGWFRGPLRETTRQRLLDNSLKDVGLFDLRFIKRLLDDHSSGISDYSAVIWALLMFEVFPKQRARQARSPPIFQETTGGYSSRWLGWCDARGIILVNDLQGTLHPMSCRRQLHHW